MGSSWCAVAALSLGLCSASLAGAGDDVPFELVQVAEVNSPTGLVTSPSDYRRVFVLEKSGQIRVIWNRALLLTPFLDLSEDVLLGASNGLYSLAFDPDYANNGLFYYTYMSANGVVLERAQRSSNNVNTADASTRDVILTVPMLSDQHNGGTIAFGPEDGYLYMSIGDGGPATPVPNRARDITLPYGKMLRIDVNGDDFPEDDARDYAIPPDNPYVGVPGAREEVWAKGLRMPWRWSFHPETHDIYFGDVGRLGMEEISRIPNGMGGMDFGWPCFEGDVCTGFFASCDCELGSLTGPVLSYPRTEGTCVVGGYFYRGCAIPELTGRYVFLDYADGLVYLADLAPDGNSFTNVEDVTADVFPDGVPVFQLLTSMGEDLYGELYITDQTYDAVYKLVRADGVPLNDCNEDGIEDACQILDGSVTDSDNDGIPNSCEAVLCPADCDSSGAVDFNDIVQMLFFFTSPPPPACDPDGSGRTDFNDLITALFLFGPCP